MFVNIMMILLSFSHAEAPVGFSGGKNFVATPIEGQVAVTCEGFNGSGQALFTCRDVTLDPGTHEYLIGPQNSQVSRVDLTATHENGGSVSKSLTYNGAQGKSQDRVNLWLSTLFQKPLLDRGVNRISYVMYKSDRAEISRGNFEVVVQRGKPRQCQPTSYTSTDLNDCHSQFSICQRYFQESDYCK